MPTMITASTNIVTKLKIIHVYCLGPDPAAMPHRACRMSPPVIHQAPAIHWQARELGGRPVDCRSPFCERHMAWFKRKGSTQNHRFVIPIAKFMFQAPHIALSMQWSTTAGCTGVKQTPKPHTRTYARPPTRPRARASFSRDHVMFWCRPVLSLSSRRVTSTEMAHAQYCMPTKLVDNLGDWFPHKARTGTGGKGVTSIFPKTVSPVRTCMCLPVVSMCLARTTGLLLSLPRGPGITEAGLRAFA